MMQNAGYNLIDVSHVVKHGMVTYKGLLAPIICDYLSREESRNLYDEGTTFQIGKIEMVANTGTYVDSPFHRFDDGNNVSELDLHSLANLNGRVFHADPNSSAIGKKLFGDVDLKRKAILVHTGWDERWNTKRYFAGHPFLTQEAAEYLKTSKVALVGIDSLNIDDTSDGLRPVHSILLGANIPIVEHLCNLSQLPDSGFTIYAVPVKVKRMGTFPVRAFGLVKT